MTTDKGRPPMQADTAFDDVQQRAAHFARQLGPHASKRLQTDFAAAGMDLEPWTAERVLMGRGSLPTILRLLKVYGWRAASFVLEPVCGRVDKLELAFEIEANRQLAVEALRKNDELARQLAATVGHGREPAGGNSDPARRVGHEDSEAPQPVAPRRRVTAR